MSGKARASGIATARRGLIGAAALLLAAGEAWASEGNLVLVPRLPMLISLLTLFVLLIFPVNALLFRPILAVLDARERRIEGTRARAEKLEADAAGLLARYEDAVRQERERAELERKQTLDAAREESATQLGRSRAEAEAEFDGARAEIQQTLEEVRAALRPQAEQLAREAAARVLGRALP